MTSTPVKLAKLLRARASTSKLSSTVCSAPSAVKVVVARKDLEMLQQQEPALRAFRFEALASGYNLNMI